MYNYFTIICLTVFLSSRHILCCNTSVEVKVHLKDRYRCQWWLHATLFRYSKKNLKTSLIVVSGQCIKFAISQNSSKVLSFLSAWKHQWSWDSGYSNIDGAVIVKLLKLKDPHAPCFLHLKFGLVLDIKQQSISNSILHSLWHHANPFLSTAAKKTKVLSVKANAVKSKTTASTH